MGMTSLVLVLLAISVRAVSWADSALQRREAERAASAATHAEETVAPKAIPDAEAPDPRARAAAIAVALALSQQSQQRSSLADQTPAPTGAIRDAWLNEGRARQRARRSPAGNAKEWR